MNRLLKKTSPGQLIALGFGLMIGIGTLLLSLPISHKPGTALDFLDILFTATSAVCVTGLLTVDIGSTFSLFGQIIIALLIQIGGLGITSLGVGIIALTGRRINFREHVLLKEALNFPTCKGLLPLIRSVLLLTCGIELVGALLSFIIFLRYFPLPRALITAFFHAIAAFNNAGMDIFGLGSSMIPYADDTALNLVTCMLIILGSTGFFVITEICRKNSFKKFSLHTKVVVTMTALLLILGTLLIKLTEGSNITWLGAFFASVTARTAGFATYSFAEFSRAGLLVMMVLMFIGASPGSTGGGMKTTTFFVLFRSLFSASTNRPPEAFRRRIPDESLHRASVIISLGMIVVILVTVSISVLEPALALEDILFEVVSAVGTVGLSTGITAGLSHLSQYILILTMFIGRLGPLTIASLWVQEPDTDISLPEENLPIG